MRAKLVVAFPAILICVAFLQPAKSLWSEFRTVSVRQLNSTDSKPLDYDLQMSRLEKGVHAVSGSLLVTDSMRKYMSEVIFQHSSKRNNNYKLMPVRVPKGTTCEKLNNEYRFFMMNDLHNTSDLPYTDDSRADICAMFIPGTRYTIRQYKFGTKYMLKFLQPGYYKVTTMFSANSVVYSGLEVVIELF